MTRRTFVAAGAGAVFAAGQSGGDAWWRRPVRMFHPNMRETDVEGMDTRRFIERCAALHADSVVVSAGGIYAFYPSKVRYHYVSPKLKGRDFLREAVEHGHAAGLKVVARVDFSKAREEAFRDHPTWFARRADGSPSRSGVYYQSCPHSPFANEEFAFPVVRELLRKYLLDGFHLNAGGFPGYCYCDSCRQAYKERFRTEIPLKADWSGEEWKRFMAWRYEVSAQHFARLHRAMTEVRKDVFWTGELAGLDEPSWMRNRAFDIAQLSTACSALMCTIDNAEPGEDFRWVSGMTASYARSVGDRPPIINLKAHIRDGGWPRTSMPAAEYAMTAWQAIAHGAGLKMPIFGVPGASEDERNLEVIARVFGVLKRHSWIYEGVKAAAPVALLWSQTTLNLYGKDDPGSTYAQSAHGMYAALTESHIPCTVIGEQHLDERTLSGFRALVLPNSACLSEAQCRAVAAFVRNGGGLMATLDTSMYDERGARRSRAGLEDILGASVDGSARLPEEAPRGSYFCRQKPHDSIGWMRGTEITAFGGRLRAVRPAATAVAPLVYGHHGNAGIPEEVDNPIRTEWPLLVASAAGRGRVVYVPGDADRFYHRSRFPDTRQLLAEAVLWVLNGRPMLRTGAPAGVGVALAEKPGWRFVHFVNTTGRAPLDEVAVLRDIRVSLEILAPVQSARAVLADAGIELRQKNGEVEFTLARLSDYEVVALDMRGQGASRPAA